MFPTLCFLLPLVLRVFHIVVTDSMGMVFMNLLRRFDFRMALADASFRWPCENRLREL